MFVMSYYYFGKHMMCHKAIIKSTKSEVYNVLNTTIQED